MKIMAGDRVFGVGTTGSGKSYLFRRLLCRLPDVIVVDPKHGFEWEKSPMKYGKGVKIGRASCRERVSSPV